ncbi:OmpA family protein [Pedobacter sp. HDW13]|uniref:OmpA family protein n=1 Tax=unclassified Pedobacter TaxID=2628915 RepID=UPI000F590F88|nr:MULTISPECIES: OmpA family protein [unclassified Pedobacter]QIL42115.1 OmpA family protein [Pedobacter sp. HDW13]RQO76651.1 flagellar motor protein MotB [Pedobacter sp. KBW01]
MNTRITKSTMLIALLGLSSQLFAQETPTATGRFSPTKFRTWSVGVHGGLLTPRTIFGNSNHQFETPVEHIGYGGYVKKQILPQLGIQADFLAGKVEELRAATGTGTFIPNTGYKTNIQWSGALSAVWNVANISINQENAILTPYLKAGAGYMSSGATTAPNTIDAGYYREGWFVPVGAGLKLGVAKGINVDLGYDVNFVKSAKFDGFNGPTNDRFAYAHAGLEFAIGDKSKPQLQNYSSLANLNKQTAEESAELRRALSTAEQNAQRDREQYAKDLGDDDNDGVANKFDKCPGTASGTVVDGSGCPIKVQREVIKETKVVVTEADRKVVKDAITNLEFDLGKSTIRSKSFATLNRVANLLVEKNFSLKLAGHTDNTGGRELNLRLSKDRAESVKAYLVSQGANASRIEAIGYGPDQPIATNKTATGRQQNRRVEFTLY